MKVYSYAQLFELPEVQQIIRGWLAERDIGLWYGQTGTWKTFSLLDQLHSVATGRDWCGIEVVQHPTLYIASEGSHTIPERVRVWAEQREIPQNARYILDGMQFGDAGNASVLEVIESCQTEGFRPRLIGIDTMAASMIGGNENLSQDIGMVIQGAKLLRDAFDAAVIITDHTGWDESREKGSASKRQHCDIVIESKKQSETSAVITQIKNRWGQKPPPITVSFSAVGGALLPDRIASDPSGLSDTDITMLEGLEKVGLRHGTWLDHIETSKATFSRRLPRLLSHGYVELIKNLYTLTDKGVSALSVSQSQAGLTRYHETESRSVVSRSAVLRQRPETTGPLSARNGTTSATQEQLEIAEYARRFPNEPAVRAAKLTLDKGARA